MVTSELRLGNIIDIKFYSESKENWNWSYVKIDDLVAMKTFPDIYRPIPLTTEWLINFGFKPFCKDWQQYGIIVHTRKRGFIINKTTIQMQYVHQLQNYVFAKTGKELCLSQKSL